MNAAMVRRVATNSGLVVAVAFGAFAVLMVIKGVNPADAYSSMWAAITTDTSLTAILVKGTPLILAALAVTIPAKAGMVNVGGEGQLLMGAIFAAGMSQAIEGAAGGLGLVLMILAGIVGGALWAGLAALLKRWVGISEAVTTLLLNYVALNIMFFLIYDPWKDPNGSGQPATRPIPVPQRLPLVGASKVHMGIVLALIATAGVWWILRSTRFGFQLRVVGGNTEAARRSGLPVGWLVIGAMLLGGALAGLGGVAQLAGSEFKLRPGFLLTYGYIGFLASWLARHDPPKVALSALLLAAISISGDSLQIDSQMPAATVNVLMALVLLAVFGFGARQKAAVA
ncbi:MAG: ABC transporter permease [Acidimicrobiales bacterium]|nr:ABC transporter permease [Acidimicrobiales bacterium]